MVQSAFKLRVSDVLDVPLRGQVLRLKVAEGSPRADSVAVGKRLRLVGPGGEEHIVKIVDHSITGGQVSQKRLERVRELDVVIAPLSSPQERIPVDFGHLVEPLD